MSSARTVFVALLACGLHAPGAWAQDPAVPLTTPIDQLLSLEVDNVVGASKHAQPVSDAPASVTIVTAEDIARHGYRDLADVLREVRGFYVTWDRNYSYVGTRGFVRPGDYNSRILLLIDGHRMNDAIFGGALLGEEFPLDLAMVQRIEIIRGPGSSLYGSSAVFGIVNVVTKQGNDEPGYTARVEGAGAGLVGAAMSHGHHTAGRWDWLLSGAQMHRDGAGDLFIPAYSGDPASGGHALNVDGSRATRIFGKAAFGGLTIQGLYGGREKHVPTGSFGTRFNDPRTRTQDQQGFVTARFETDPMARQSFSARVFYDRYAYNGFYPYGATEDDSVLNRDLSRAESWGVEAQISRPLTKPHRVTAGFEFRDDFRQLQQNYDVAPLATYVDSRTDSRSISVYAQDEWRLGAFATVEAGLRHDHYSRFGGQTTPRAALILTPAPRSRAKLLYGTAFRAPTVYELFWTQAAVSKSNPDLKSERSQTVEAAFEQYFSRWRLSANAFYYDLARLISQRTDPADRLLVYGNLDSARVSGVEAEVERRFKSGAKIRLSETLPWTTNRQLQERLPNSPRSLFQTSATAPLWRDMSIAADAVFISARQTDSGGAVPGYGVVNLALTRRPATGRLDMALRLKNVFDTRYVDLGSEELHGIPVPQDGRAIHAQLRLRF